VEAGWAVLGSVVTAVAGALALLLKTVFDQRRQSRADAIAEQGAIINRLEAQVERMQRQADEAMQALERVRDAHADCEVRLERTLGWCQRLHDAVVRSHACLRKLGGDPGPDPEMPPPPAPRDPRQDPDFIVRTEKQVAELSKALADRARGQAAPPPVPAPAAPPPGPGGAGT
jgi:hypothetical protein